MGCNDCGRTASLSKDRSPGMQVVTLSRPSCEEIFAVALPIDGEEPGAMFGRIAEMLAGRKASVVSQEVFGLHNRDGSGTALLEAAMGKVTWPVTWVESGTRSGIVGTILWTVAGPKVEPVRVSGRIIGSLFEDRHVRYYRMGGLVPADVSRSREDQTNDVFALIEAGLAATGMDFGNVVRTWFCNDEILDWYDEFNRERDEFFKKRGVFDGLVPASTGVGGRNAAGAALVSGALAVVPKSDEVKTFAVASPLQCPALEYGSSFSRAVEIDAPDHRRVLVSGTASIAPEGHTVHLDDVSAQLSLTMDVVRAILESRDMSWADVSRAISYFKHSDDVHVFGEYCVKAGLPDLPAVLVYDDICRDDLLFEIEIDAISTSPAK